MRTGEGALVEGAALDAHLLERIDRPGLLGELYAIRFHPGRRAPRRRTRSGSRSCCTSTWGRSASARRTRPSTSNAGDYARYSGSVPHVYEALGGGRGHPADDHREVAMKRAHGWRASPASASTGSRRRCWTADVLRLENLDTDLPLPPEAVAVTREALDDPVSNSWLPFTGDLGLRAAISDHMAARHGRTYDPEREIVVTCGGCEAMLDVLLATIDPGDEVVLTDPVYAGLVNRVRLAGGMPVFAPLR